MPDPINISDLPEALIRIVERLNSYDFILNRDADGIWILTFPAGDRSGITQVEFRYPDLMPGLIRVLRNEEMQRGVLHRYEQFDRRWAREIYGNSPLDTNIGHGGCGPTSLAIVLQYLMNNRSRRQNASHVITPLQTALYAARHGRVSATRLHPSRGTNGDAMIAGIHRQWPEFSGSRINLTQAITLLEEGNLVIFLCTGCRGFSRSRPVHRQPDVSYSGHYMVLSAVDRAQGSNQIFHVLDPGRNAAGAMRFITRTELLHRSGGFWWVYRLDDLGSLICGG